jgi:hypothetical protein
MVTNMKNTTAKLRENFSDVNREKDSRLCGPSIGMNIGKIDKLLDNHMGTNLDTNIVLNSKNLLENWGIIYSGEISKFNINYNDPILFSKFKKEKSEELINKCFTEIIRILKNNGFSITYNKEEYQEIISSSDIEKSFKITLNW